MKSGGMNQKTGVPRNWDEFLLTFLILSRKAGIHGAVFWDDIDWREHSKRLIYDRQGVDQRRHRLVWLDVIASDCQKVVLRIRVEADHIDPYRRSFVT